MVIYYGPGAMRAAIAGGCTLIAPKKVIEELAPPPGDRTVVDCRRWGAREAAEVIPGAICVAEDVDHPAWTWALLATSGAITEKYHAFVRKWCSVARTRFSKFAVGPVKNEHEWKEFIAQYAEYVGPEQAPPIDNSLEEFISMAKRSMDDYRNREGVDGRWCTLLFEDARVPTWDRGGGI